MSGVSWILKRTFSPTKKWAATKHYSIKKVSFCDIHAQATRTWKGKKISPPPKKFPKIFPPRFEGLSLWWFSTPHLEFWADFPPSYEFWHQNPQGKHQNSLKSGKEKFSTPLKISWKFSLWKIFPPHSTTCLCMYETKIIFNHKQRKLCPSARMNLPKLINHHWIATIISLFYQTGIFSLKRLLKREFLLGTNY